MEITVTKCAVAYVELDSNKRTKIASHLIADVIPVSKNLGIGNAIVFLTDGTSLNVTESVGEIYRKLKVVKKYFELGFGKN